MIIRKTSKQLMLMREAGRITANAIQLAGKAVEPGVSTMELETIIRKYIEAAGATPSCLGYGGYPAASCISVNNVVIHGIPSNDIILKSGDIVSIDVVSAVEGYCGDATVTFACGDISENARRLLETTEAALYEGIAQAKTGNRIGDISNAVQRYAEARGYSVVRDFTGHGVGASMHEDPQVPNFGNPHRGARIEPGMTLAIEPMINEGAHNVRILDDDWTVVTCDGKLAAHFEHTVAITNDGTVILTTPDI